MVSTMFKKFINKKQAANDLDHNLKGFEPNILGKFLTFEDWVNTASHKLTYEVHAQGKAAAVCIDSAGRRCHIGSDFMRARDENTFPVYYFCDFKKVQ